MPLPTPTSSPSFPSPGLSSPEGERSHPSALAQWVLDRWLQASTHLQPHHPYLLALRALRKLLIHSHDPLIQYDLGSARLRLPLSHGLPMFQRQTPAYGRNLANLAQIVSQKYPDMTAIDIGANVGDTAALLIQAAHCPLLCIEGEPRYFSVLQANAQAIAGDIELENVLVGLEDRELTGRITSSIGTAQVVPHQHAPTLRFRTLPSILQSHPRFLRPRLIKIDTDGYDCLILRGARDFLAQTRPILFFEYVPPLFLPHDPQGFDVFAQLRQAGYHHALAYHNTGQLRNILSLSDVSTLQILHDHYAHHVSNSYLDFCVFPPEDADVFEQLARLEKSPPLRQAA